MTVLGISGCTALLVAGFGIKDSISRIVNSQFGEIFQYQGIASLQKDLDETEKQQVFDQISSLDMIDDSLDVYQSNAVVYQGNDSTEVTLVVTSDPERFRDLSLIHILSVRMPQEMRILMLHSDLSEQISSWLVSLLEVLAKEWALFPFNRDAEFHALCRMFSASLFQGVREVFSQAGELDQNQLCEVLRIYFGLFLSMFSPAVKGDQQ